MITRRSLLLAAPAVVAVTSLMPIRGASMRVRVEGSLGDPEDINHWQWWIHEGELRQAIAVECKMREIGYRVKWLPSTLRPTTQTPRWAYSSSNRVPVDFMANILVAKS